MRVLEDTGRRGLDHLGRIVDGEGLSVGTCFQVHDGVLVTAWHVLCSLTAESVGSVVEVGQLTGGLTLPATVVRVDPENDLAVLRCEVSLAASVDGLRETGGVGTGTAVAVSGVAEVDDPGHEISYLDRASGQWGGQLARDGTTLGHLKCRDVMRGMSGAPVTLPGGTEVIGVVSARYNSTDGWLRDSVWISRTEALRPLLAGLADGGTGMSESLPDGVTELLSRMREMLDQLPYAPPEYASVPLLQVYVSQSVAEPVAPRQPRAGDFEDHDHPFPDREIPEVERKRLALLVQPFEEVFGQHRHLVVQGDGGMGKTTLAHHLVLRLVEQTDDEKSGAKIPILLPARTMAEHLGRSWPAMLRAAAQDEYGPFDSDLPESTFAGPVAGRRWQIVVDALDEIPDPARRRRLLAVLAERMAQPGGSVDFVVTSRPLQPGEIGQLQKSGVGFCDLQRFDEEALERFARSWLGETRAERFLSAVRRSRLEDLIQVPLLATVAVQVYQGSPDHQLPPSHYRLYERYIELSVTRRDAEAQRILAQLPATADGQRLRDWLPANRWALLEHLAKAYTTSERQLLPVAEQFLTGHIPELDRLPADWGRLLVLWLAQTGIVNPGRRHLRFTHLTFAEHLAATADARALPAVFDPDQSELAELLTSARLGIESTVRTLLHYLHLHERDPLLLDQLQSGAREDRVLAGQLIAKGAPCTDEQLIAYVEQIEERTLADGSLDQDSVSTVVGSPVVRERLLGLLKDTHVDLESKISLIDLLHEQSGEAKRYGIALLRQELPAAFPFSVRRRGAGVLARLGVDQREPAVRVLSELARDVTADDDDRLAAAEDLARLPRGGRDRAREAFRTLARSASVAPEQRRGAAYALVKLGGEARVEAAEVLHLLASDPVLGAGERRQAAEDLARLGGEHRGQGVADLVALADGPAARPGERALALAAVAAFNPEFQEQAAEALHAFGADPTADAADRCAAAKALGRLGSEFREWAATDLLGIASDKAVATSDRAQAIHGLVELGDVARPQAVGAAVDFAASADGYELSRVSVFNELVKPGTEHRAVIGQALHRIAADPTTFAYIRAAAATKAAELGGPLYEQAAADLEDLILDPGVSSFLRWHAVQPLAKLGKPWVGHLAVQLQALLRQRWISSQDRILAVAALTRLKPGAEALAATVLIEVARKARGDIWVESEIAELIDDLGRPWSEHAAAVRSAFIRRPTSSSYFAFEAARQLIARGTRVDETAEILSWLVAVSPDDPDAAWETVTELARKGGVARSRAIAVLTAVVQNPGQRSSARRQAAHRLLQLGEAETGVLGTIAQDRLADDDERLTTIELLIRLGLGDDSPVASLLCSLAVEQGAETDIRRRAAALLTRLPPVHRGWAADRLRSLVSAAPPGGAERAFAWAALAKLEPGRRTAAEAEMGEFVADPGGDGEDRLQVAELLVEFGAEHHRLLSTALAEMAADREGIDSHRRRAAVALAKLGVEHRDTAARLFRGQGADPAESEWHRRRVALALAGLGAEHQRSALTLLHDIAVDRTLQHDERTAAAKAMVDFAAEHMSLVTADLGALAADEAIGAAERLETAFVMAGLPGAAKADAVRLIDRLVADDATDLGIRWRAVGRLVGLGLPARPAAIRALAALTADRDVDVRHRLGAAAQLANLGPQARSQALQMLREAATETTEPPRSRLDQALVAAAIAEIDDEHASVAVDLLTEAATEEGTPTWQRLVAVEALAAGERHQHGRCTRMFHRMAASASARGWERRIAAEQLARYGPNHTSAAVDLLSELARDRGVGPGERVEAMVALAGFAPGRCADTTDALAVIAADESTSVPERCSAANALTIINSANRDLAGTVLERIAADHRLIFKDRVRAAVDFAALQRGHRAAATLLRQLVDGTEAGSAERALALDDLSSIDLRHKEEARVALLNLARDVDASPEDRRLAATALPHWGASDTTVGTDILLALAEGDGPEVDRALALRELARWRPSRQRQAVTAIGGLTPAQLSPRHRCQVHAALAELRPAGRRRNYEAICAQITDPAAEPPDRIYAIETLNRLLSVTHRVTGMWFMVTLNP